MGGVCVCGGRAVRDPPGGVGGLEREEASGGHTLGVS